MATAAYGSPEWEAIKNGIFAGESGGDYNALYGWRNREGGEFAGFDLSNMTVDDAIRFSMPSSPYAQSVKNELGYVATPMGGYQIVGSTLRNMKDLMGLKGDEKMTPEMQDRIGYEIYKSQGTDAWEGYRGPMEEQPVNRTQRGDKPLLSLADEMGTASDNLTGVMQDMQGTQEVLGGIAGALLTSLSPADIRKGLMQQGIGQFAELAASGTEQAKMPMSMNSGTPLSPDAANLLPPSPKEVANPTISTSGGGAEAGPQGFTARALQKLFPNVETDEARREKGRDVLSALSTGLGQMSAGQAVNLNPVFDRIQQRNAMIANRAQEQQNLNLQTRRAQMEQDRLDLDIAKQSLEEVKFYNGLSENSFSDQQLERFAADKATARLVPMLASPDPKIREQAAETLFNIEQKRSEAMLKALEGVGEDNTALGNAVREWQTATPDRRGELLQDMTLDQIKQFSNLPDIDSPASVQEFDSYMKMLDDDPEKAQAYLQMMGAKAGGLNPEMQQAVANYEDGRTYRKSLVESVGAANQIDGAVTDIVTSLDELTDPTAESSKADGWKAWATGWVRALGREEAEKFEEVTGLNADDFNRLDGATARLVIMASRPMVQGQGTITDSERTALARALAQDNLTNEARLDYAFRLKALNEMDRTALSNYDANKGTAFKNHETAQTDNVLVLEPKQSEISNAWSTDEKLFRAKNDPEKYKQFVEEFRGMSAATMIEQNAVTVNSLDEYDSIKSLLSDNLDKPMYNLEDGLYYYVPEGTDTPVPVDMEAMSEQLVMGE